MIYFRPTISALKAHIAELQVRLAASEAERQALLDRLLEKNRFSPVTETAPAQAASPALQYIAPPGVNPVEIQDALRDVWIQEEAMYLMNELGYADDRAWAQAKQNYEDQHKAA